MPKQIAKKDITIQLIPASEDYLERLYMREVEHDPATITPPDDRVISELLRHNLVQANYGDRLSISQSKLRSDTGPEGDEGRRMVSENYITCPHILTPAGLQQAESAVRRHRLAERLLQDVVDVHGKRVDEAACEFEHSLHHGIDEHICTLLGHPKTCPHGRPIPPGRCCREHKGAAQAAVMPLSEMKAGERGTIAYLSTRQLDAMQKLMALGVLPGSPVEMIQTFPSVAFQVNQTQVALDTLLAQDIYVRRSG